MNEKFNKCIDIILRNEGGLVDDPDDTGGITNYGISYRFLSHSDWQPSHGGLVTADDIRNLTKGEACEIYFKYFWKPLQLEQLKNDSLALQVFDMAVNCGNVPAIRLLQKLVGVKVDGKIGPKTIEAANTFTDDLAGIFRKARHTWYSNLVIEKPQFKKFLAGWLNRVDKTQFA
jgi:type VI secretion system secreted protein VgrG